MQLFDRALVCLGLCLALVGCGGAETFPTAKTTGVVLCEGKPVPKAQVYFEPLQEGKSAKVGKQAFAFSDAEGKFVLSTYGDNDGAVVGKHRVRVGGDPSVPCDCETNSEMDVMTVDIEKGKENVIEVVLKKKAAKPPRKAYDPDAEDAANDLQN